MAGPGIEYYQISPEWKDPLAAFGLKPGGVCRAEAFPEEELRYRAWLEEGREGEMSYLKRHLPLKFNPQALVPGTRSLVFFTLDYWQDLPPPPEGAAGRTARYAWGRDYHKTLGNRLRNLCIALEKDHPGETFRSFTDSGPLAERYYARNAGLGFLGKHTLLIHPAEGSWFLLGEVFSSLPVEFWTKDPSGQGGLRASGACPSGCFRCGKICPTGALTAPGVMDARRCISYLTIEHKGTIPLELRPLMGTWVFGCDLCQEVCPFNLRPEKTGEMDFLRWRLGPWPDLDGLLSLEDSSFQERFAGTPVWRTGRRSLVRNACVAAGNSGDMALRTPLQALASGEDSLLAEHALWALERLGGRE